MQFADARVERVLADYEKRSAAEAQRHQRGDFGEVRDQFLLAVGPATGTFLNVLARGARARAILEIGTSYGYSTLWLAEAARHNQGRVVTLDWHAYKQDYAREQLERAGLADFVDFVSGDARELLQSLTGPFDLVLLDLWKDLYIPCFDLFYPRLGPGAIVVADNMTFPEASQAHARLYQRHVREKPDLDSILLPIGSGIEVSRKFPQEGGLLTPSGQ